MSSAPASTSSPSAARAVLWLLAAMQFAHILDFMIMMPLSPQLMRVLGISQDQFGWLVSVYTLAAGLSGLLFARWMDRYSRRQLLLGLFVGFVVGTAACAWAPNYTSLLLARMITGMFGGVMSGLVQAYVADLLPPEQRGWGMGIIMTAFSVSSVAGVPFGIWLGTLWGWRAPFVFLVLASLLILALAYRRLPVAVQPQISHGGLWDVLAERQLWPVFGFTFLLVMAGFTVIPYISPYLVHNVGFSEGELAYFYLAGGAATLFTGRWFGRLADRYGKLQTYLTLALASACPILWLTHLQPHHVGLGVLVGALFMVLVSGRFIPAMALISTQIPGHLRGRFMSVNTSVQQMATGFAAWAGGLVLAQGSGGRLLHYNQVGYLAVGATMLAMALAVRMARKNPAASMAAPSA